MTRIRCINSIEYLATWAVTICWCATKRSFGRGGLENID